MASPRKPKARVELTFDKVEDRWRSPDTQPLALCPSCYHSGGRWGLGYAAYRGIAYFHILAHRADGSPSPKSWCGIDFSGRPTSRPSRSNQSKL